MHCTCVHSTQKEGGVQGVLYTEGVGGDARWCCKLGCLLLQLPIVSIKISALPVTGHPILFNAYSLYSPKGFFWDYSTLSLRLLKNFKFRPNLESDQLGVYKTANIKDNMYAWTHVLSPNMDVWDWEKAWSLEVLTGFVVCIKMLAFPFWRSYVRIVEM